MAHTVKPARGTCATCNKRVRINLEGNVYAHPRYTDENCPGSYEPPLPGSVTTPEVVEYGWLDRNYWAINFTAALIVGFTLGFFVAVGIFEGCW